jgi:small-conductance mechanosensitive channel
MQTQFIDNIIFFFTDIYSKIIIKVVVALIIILFGFIIAKIIGKSLYKLFHELNINSIFKKATGLNTRIDHVLSLAVTYLIDFFVIIIALDAIALASSVIYIFSAAIIIIIIFSIIIGIKDIFPNIIAGIAIYRKDNLKPGDHIQIKNHKGRIEKITLTETIIKKKNKDYLYIPNSEIITNEIIKKN